MRFPRAQAFALTSGLIVLLSMHAQTPHAQSGVPGNLAQVDAVVRGDGGPVNGLTAADFEIYEDGRPQQIIAATPQPNRTASFLIDACLNVEVHREDGVPVRSPSQSPAWGVPYLRTERAVAEFLDGALQETKNSGDRFAFLSTHDGSARADEPTADRDRLRDSSMRIPLPGRLLQGCVPSDGPERGIMEAIPSRLEPVAHNWGMAYVHYDSVAAVYQTISLAIDELSDLPGHKDLLVFAALIRPDAPLTDPQLKGRHDYPRGKPFLKELTTRANRAGVSISILDLNHKVGPPAPLCTPVSFHDGSCVGLVNYRYDDSANDGALSKFAADTGGVYSRLPAPPGGKLFRVAMNVAPSLAPYDFFGVLHHYEQDLLDSALASSVYLISYMPEAISGASHKIEVKVRRPGITVRSRAFLFDTGIEKNPVERLSIARPAAEELAQALRKPLRGTPIDLRAMPFDRAHQGAKGLSPVIDLVLSVDAHDLTWTKLPDGSRKARIDSTAAWYRHDIDPPEGTVTHSCELTQTSANAADQAGPVQCNLEIDPAGPGLYFVRAAVRDAASGRLGTASTLAPAPNYNSDYLMMSAPRLQETSAGEALSVDAVFAPGEYVSWQIEAYGMQRDRKTNDPELSLRISLGNEVTYKPAAIGTDDVLTIQGSGVQVPLKGRFQLPADLAPGDYVMQFLMTDEIGRDKRTGGPEQNSRVAEFHISAPGPAVTQH